MSGDQQLITNEQIKLRATFWNNLAVATVAGGIFLPFYNYFRDPSHPFWTLNRTDMVPGVIAALLAVIAMVLMRLHARRTLARLAL
jgi:hypothetical protein